MADATVNGMAGPVADQAVDEQLLRELTERAREQVSLSAKGLATEEISAHLAEIYGAEVSKQTISTITGRGRPVAAARPTILPW